MLDRWREPKARRLVVNGGEGTEQSSEEYTMVVRRHLLMTRTSVTGVLDRPLSES